MFREFRSSVTAATDGLRQDVQPLVKMLVSSQLRGMGLSEQTIGDILKAPPANQPNSAAELRRAAQVREQWEK